MKRILIITILVALYCIDASAGAPDCVLPVADGGDIEPSPASVQGIIAKVTHNQIALKGQLSTSIQYGSNAELFTVYGGFVKSEELKVGQHVFVWYVGCKAETEALPVAAVIQLCSTAAEPCL